MAKSTAGTSAGLLITPRSIVGVQARVRGGDIEVKVRGAVETPPDTISGQDAIDPIRLGHAIRNLWRRMGMTEETVSLALVAPAYGLRALRLPAAPERERPALVRGELEQAQVLPRDSGTFDFIWVAATDAGGGSAQADIYCYYATDSVVDGFRRALQTAGLKLASIEPASVAMIRVFLATRGKREPVAILCPSAKHTDLCIHDGTHIRQLRRLPAGWEDVMHEPDAGSRDMVPQADAWDRHVPGERRDSGLNLAEGESIPEKEPGEGEIRLLEEGEEQRPALHPAFQGFPAVWPGQGSIPDEEADPDVEMPRVGQSPLGGQPVQRSDFLVSEVTRSLAFYAREYPEEMHPRELVILGQADAARAYERVLATTQTVPVVVANPLSGIDLPRAVAPPGVAEEPEAYMGAIGTTLAPAGAELGMPRMDLSKREGSAQGRRRMPQAVRVGAAWSTLWLVAASIAAITLMVMETRLADEHVRITNEIARIEAERAPLVRRAEQEKAAAAARRLSEIPAAPVLGRVAAAATTGVALTNLRLTPDGKVAIEGKALGTSNVQRFALNVGRGTSIKLPIIETTKRDNTARLTFRIGALFREPAPAAPAKGKE